MKIRGRAVLAVMAYALALGLGTVRAQELAPPSLPVDAYKKNDKGILVVAVTFAKDGTVSSCRIVRSNVPYTLEAGTVDFIKRKWMNPFFAGSSVLMPITFDQLPWYVKHWDDALVPPPNFLPDGDPGRNLKLRVSFGRDGWAQHVQVTESSGLDTVDRETALWVKIHWHNEAFAGQTLDAPFNFKAPLGAKPVVVKKPTPPKPLAPLAPVEPVAAPAERVQ